MKIAVIGAGLAGLTCAGQLSAHGHSVTVYEKSHSAAGRMSTRETELGGFDHGAQYFTARQPAFQRQVAAWRKSGLVDLWKARFVTLEAGVTTVAGRSSQRFVAVPGMNALGRHLAKELDVRTGQRVTRIESYHGGWLLRVSAETVAIEASAGPFDAVIVALPADQAVALLEAVPTMASQAGRARMAPCWSLLLGFEQELKLGFDGAWVKNSRLAWIAHDASKPQRRPGEHWVGHASGEWSAEHLEDDPERVKEKLLRAFHSATASDVQPVYAAVHRWRFAQAVEPLPSTCLWDPQLRIGACGDWFAAGLDGAGRIENAYLSAAALAESFAA
ncbi:NAD(P)/FAD-dependent oxidoreductase [Noviherbaspirillum sp.]|uniref:NAD(P)/FAD-dependent oxidoreductase n=1 Tax=Noviherbaspirillum sp. TaxID=1926288 RepID=UPI002FE24D8E